MSRSNSVPQIVDLNWDDLDQAAEVMAAAFRDDPLVNYVLGATGEDFSGCILQFFRFTCEIRLVLNWPIWGVIANGELQGVACLSLPEEAEWPPSLSASLESLRQRMGPVGAERLERYAEIVSQHTPDEPNYFFGALGVHPRAQGQGLSSMLLDQTHQLVERHPTATGIALDTEKPVNVAIYQRFGYQITSEDQIDGITIWSMFRPNGAEENR